MLFLLKINKKYLKCEKDMPETWDKMFATQTNKVYTYSGILFSLKKEGNSDTCYNMDQPQIHYAKWNKPVTKGQISVRFHLYDVPRIVKCIETK